jgi:hypothetical protein
MLLALYLLGVHVFIPWLCLCSGNQLSVNLWGKTATDFDGDAIRNLGKTEPVIIIFVGTLVKTYDGVLIFIAIPSYIVCLVFYLTYSVFSYTSYSFCSVCFRSSGC